MPVFKVIIVGGGLSGTLLANGLLNNEVEFMLYERDASDSKREGYQIRLGEAAMIGFQSCLTGDQIASVQHKFGQSLGGSSTAPSLYTSSFKRILDLTSLPSYTKSSAINRVTLRNLLMESVQRAGKVAFNKAFSHYEIVPNIDGEVKVKVYFADGTHDTGDILIGADGSGSLVNKQVGAQNLVAIQSHWVFLSKGQLPYKRIQELPSVLQKGPIIAFNKKGAFFYALYLPPKNNRNISFSESGEYEEAEASFYWGLNVPREAFENGADPRNIENKREFLLEYIRDWAPEYHQMLTVDSEEEHSAGVQVVPLRASIKLSKSWRSRLRKRPEHKAEEGHPRVWLMGDAVHAMQPNRGQGGNQALQDCADMLPQLLSLNELARRQDTLSFETIDQACMRYEAAMIDRAFKWVKKSGGASFPKINLDGVLGTIVYLISKLVLPVVSLFYKIWA